MGPFLFFHLLRRQPLSLSLDSLGPSIVDFFQVSYAYESLRPATHCFIPTANAEAARAFYEGTLGLEFVGDDNFALVFNSGGIMLRIIRVGDFTPAPFGVFGWEAPDMDAAVDALIAKGITFERYSYFEQDARGIWTAPNANKVAWFKDPDGNTLSVSNHD